MQKIIAKISASRYEVSVLSAVDAQADLGDVRVNFCVGLGAAGLTSIASFCRLLAQGLKRGSY